MLTERVQPQRRQAWGDPYDELAPSLDDRPLVERWVEPTREGSLIKGDIYLRHSIKTHYLQYMYMYSCTCSQQWLFLVNILRSI